MSALEMTMLGFAMLLALAALGFWFAMIRDCWLNTPPGGSERWIWLLIVVLGKFPGAFAYFLLRKKRVLG